MLVLAKNEYSRYTIVQTVTHWRGKVLGVPEVYIGDSLTAAGRNWQKPFAAINLAADGYLAWQIEGLAKRALDYKGERLFILAGTNDIITGRPFEIDLFREEYGSLLDTGMATPMQVFVTEIPYTSDPSQTEPIAMANDVIRELTLERDIPLISLNSKLAPEGVLLPRYTMDGVHLTDPAYRYWRSQINQAIEAHGPRSVPGAPRERADKKHQVAER